jgi:hypothetical protein
VGGVAPRDTQKKPVVGRAQLPPPYISDPGYASTSTPLE